MPADHAVSLTKLALLIDGDNVQAKFMPKIMEYLAPIGTVAIRRIYGQFGAGKMRAWEKRLAEFDLTQVNVSPARSGKNATDIALVIEAMDMLAGRGLDGICIASSDSDFTPLARRIRTAAVAAYGVGEAKAPKAYKDAFDKFFELGDAEPTRAAPTRSRRAAPVAKKAEPKSAPTKSAPPPPPPARQATAPKASAPSRSARSPASKPAETPRVAPTTPETARGASSVPIQELLAAIDRVKRPDGWSHLRDLGNELERAGFSPAKNRYKVANLVRLHPDRIEVTKRGNHPYVRCLP